MNDLFNRLAAAIVFIVVGGISLYFRVDPLLFALTGWGFVLYLLLPKWTNVKAFLASVASRFSK